MPFTEAQQWALMIAPKITGFISLVFSGLVILAVLICPEKRSKTYHRLLLGISCVDASSSFWLGLSTWPIPKETGILLASGSTASCTVQGFFTEFGVASSFYNASLSFFYLLVIRYGWKEDRILKLEPWLHAIPVTWGLGTAIAGVPLTIFNSANLWCWIAPYKNRGANADLYRWAFFYGPLWIMILIVTVNLILIFRHVRATELAMEKYQQHLTMRPPDVYQIRYSGDLGAVEESNLLKEAAMGRNEGEDNREKCNSTDDIEGGDDNRETAKEMSGTRRDGDNSDGRDAETQSATKQSTSKVTRRLSTFVSSVSFRNNTTSDSRNQRRRSRAVANQSLRYAGSFYFTWIALTLTRLLQTVNGKTYYPLLLIAAITTPLQGLPNFLVYLYPRWKKAKKAKPEAGALSWLKDSLAPESTRHRNAPPTRSGE